MDAPETSDYGTQHVHVTTGVAGTSQRYMTQHLYVQFKGHTTVTQITTLYHR